MGLIEKKKIFVLEQTKFNEN